MPKKTRGGNDPAVPATSPRYIVPVASSSTSSPQPSSWFGFVALSSLVASVAFFMYTMWTTFLRPSQTPTPPPSLPVSTETTRRPSCRVVVRKVEVPVEDDEEEDDEEEDEEEEDDEEEEEEEEEEEKVHSPPVRPPVVRPPLVRPPVARTPIARPPVARTPSTVLAAIEPSLPPLPRDHANLHLHSYYRTRFHNAEFVSPNQGRPTDLSRREHIGPLPVDHVEDPNIDSIHRARLLDPEEIETISFHPWQAPSAPASPELARAYTTSRPDLLYHPHTTRKALEPTKRV